MNKHPFFYIIILLLAIFTLNSASAITIQLSGSLPNDIQKNILSVLTEIKQQSSDKNYASTNNFTLLAKKKIIAATSPFGYFSPTIHIKQINKKFFFHIQLNRPVILQSIDIKVRGPGHDDPPFKKFLQHLPLRPGMILSTEKYVKIKNKLFSLAAKRGYFKSKMTTSNIKINVAKRQATINLVLQTGIRYRFGKTILTKTPLKNSFINKFVSYKKGEFYLNSKVQQSQIDLTNSGYFQQAIITPEPSKIHDGIVPMHIYLVPVIRTAYTFGLGYSTDAGIRGLANITNNYLNSRGHKFKVTGQVAQKSQNITATYTIPGYQPQRHYYTITSALSQFTINNNNSRAMKFTLGSTHLFNRWESILSLNALKENYALTNISTQATLFYPQAQIQYKYLDNPMRTQNGIIINISAVGALQALSSTSSFAQFSYGIRALKTIKRTHTRLLARGNIATTNIDSINHLPLSLQLFAGGSQSIRGYEYQSIGSGKNLFTASAEIQQKVYKAFYATAFFDTGNVSNNADIFKDPYSAAGVGVAWLSPIGILELTAADPLKKGHSDWLFQFSMGAYL